MSEIKQDTELTALQERFKTAVFVIGGRHIIGTPDNRVNEFIYLLNPFQIFPLEDGKITLLPAAIGSKLIELNYNNVEFAYDPNDELVKFYNETIENYTEFEAKEKAKKAGIILSSNKVVDLKMGK